MGVGLSYSFLLDIAFHSQGHEEEKVGRTYSNVPRPGLDGIENVFCRPSHR